MIIGFKSDMRWQPMNWHLNIILISQFTERISKMRRNRVSIVFSHRFVLSDISFIIYIICSRTLPIRTRMTNITTQLRSILHRTHFNIIYLTLILLNNRTKGLSHLRLYSIIKLIEWHLHDFDLV